MNALKRTQTQANEFTSAIKDWLAGEVTGNLGAYMYTDDNDDHRWKDGHSAKNYYLGRDDKASFDMAINDLDLNINAIFDLGPGGADSVYAKTIPLISKLHAKNYYPIDLAPTLAATAAQTVSQKVDISVHPITADFFKPISASAPNALVAFMGGTLGNIETHPNKESLGKRLSQLFENYRNMVQNNGYLLESFDANTNSQEVVDCYQSEQFAELIKGCVGRAIDTSIFDYDVVWSGDTYQLALGLRAKEDRIIKFDGEEFAIEKGEFLSVLNSYRYPVEFVTEAARKVGWAYQKSWSATGRVHYLLFQAAKLAP